MIKQFSHWLIIFLVIISVNLSGCSGGGSGGGDDDPGGGEVDTTAPEIPDNLSASTISSSRIDLTWNASTDNVAVTGYTLTRNDGQTFTSTGTSFSNTGLSSATLYSYTVTASDAAGNTSAASGSASATTTDTSTSSLSISADNSIVDNSSERSVNMGGASSIRLKTYQHHLILNADTSAISGRKVVGATLRYRRNSQTLEHVTVSSIQGDWVEGTSGGFSTQEGSSCFLASEYHADTNTLIPWSFPGSRFVDVVYGNGNSLMGFSDCPQNNNYYEWTVPADIVNAIAVGASYGIAVFESSHLVNRNPTVYSRESSQYPPELVVVTEAADPTPLAVRHLASATSGIDRGEARLTWMVPENTFSYNMTIEGGTYSSPTPVPRYLIPFATQTDSTQDLVLKDILEPGTSYTVSVTAVARGGAQSPAEEVTFIASNLEAYPDTTLSIGEPATNGSGFSVGDLSAFAIPVTDKILPNGDLVETVPANYTIQNAVFDGDTISLRGALNDILAFQLVLKDNGTEVTDITVSATVPDLTANLDRIGFINTDDGMIAEVLRGSSATYTTRMDENATSQTAQSILVELTIPNTIEAFTKTGTIVIESSSGNISIPLSIRIDNFSLPDKPTFKCEMNDYGYPSYQATFDRLQTVARRFRTHVNLVPYSQSRRTRMDLYLPGGGQMDESAYNNFQAGDTTGYWDDFVTGFAPSFDSSLYSGGPWSSAAIPGFYLTFHESWPLVARDYYNDGTKDAYTAFPVTYENTFKAILGDFVTLAKTNSWYDAGFQVYLNNKPRGDHYTIGDGSTPWTLDEPVNFWDFRALGYYGQLFKDGAGAHAPVDLKYRIDISRYPYHRGQLDGLVDLAVVNRDLYVFRRLIFDIAKKDSVEIWNYGTANRVTDSNVSAAGWILSCYAMGGSGILPWSTVHDDADLLNGVTGNDLQQRSLFIITDDGQTPVVYPSLRLAAFREGEILAEYLAFLKDQGGFTTGQMERLINNYLDLDTAFSVSGSYAEDAGTISFDDLTSTQLWQLRTHVLDTIDALSS